MIAVRNKKVLPWTLKTVVLFIFLGAGYYFVKYHGTTKLTNIFGQPPKKQADFNVIFFSLDTLTKDHLGTYGYKRDTTPFLDSLARESIVFTNAFSTAGYTIPAHYSMFTGVYPATHKILLIEEKNVLDLKFKTIPQYLSEKGFSTYYFGHGKGDPLQPERGILGHFNVEKRGGLLDEDSLLELMKLQEDMSPARFFLFCHSYLVHDPYDPPSPFHKLYDLGYKGQMIEDRLSFEKNLEEFQKAGKDTEKLGWYQNGADIKNAADVEHLKALYDGEIRYLDFLLDIFFRKLKQLNLYDKSIIIITADHGDAFGEHGKFAHLTVHDEIIKVPLMIKIPGVNPGLINSLVDLTDLLPTIMDLTGIEIPAYIEGKSLLPLIKGKQNKIKEYTYSQIYDYAAVRSLEWKYIKEGVVNEELYHVASDPGERKNLAKSEQEKKRELKQRLEDYLLSHL